ncbi:MAG: hypothetical protein HYZ53_22865 [Planctomycetes bacterium]|nr:hypothetical protein [Planctomycetota bacterium]
MDLSALRVGEPEEELRRMARSLSACRTVEQACTFLCRELHYACRRPEDGESSLVLNRVFLSLPGSALEEECLRSVREKLGAAATPQHTFLALLGSYGALPEWRDPRRSAGHRAILLDRKTVDSAPMLARCFQQIGFNLDVVLRTDSGARFEGVTGAFGLFHVADALGSPYVPAQEEFVKPRGVRSVVGCGTMLPDGAVSIWIGFTRHRVPYEAAIPLLPLMPSFWHLVQSLYRRKALHGS